MEFLSALALVLLTLVGYSTGAVWGAKDKTPSPQILDLIVVVVLWIAALVSRASLGKWMAVAVWMVVAALLSWLLSRARRATMPGKTTQTLVHGQGGSGPSLIWQRWKVFVAEIGDYQGRALLGFFYFVVVTPFGVGVRLFSDPLHIKASTDASAWTSRSTEGQSLDEARRQY